MGVIQLVKIEIPLEKIYFGKNRNLVIQCISLLAGKLINFKPCYSQIENHETHLTFSSFFILKHPVMGTGNRQTTLPDFNASSGNFPGNFRH